MYNYYGYPNQYPFVGFIIPPVPAQYGPVGFIIPPVPAPHGPLGFIIPPVPAPHGPLGFIIPPVPAQQANDGFIIPPVPAQHGPLGFIIPPVPAQHEAAPATAPCAEGMVNVQKTQLLNQQQYLKGLLDSISNSLKQVENAIAALDREKETPGAK